MLTSEDVAPVTLEDQLQVAILCNLEQVNLQLAELVEANAGNGKVGLVASANPPAKRSRRPRKSAKETGEHNGSISRTHA